MKTLHERLDDILIDPMSRTEENPDGSWSSTRVLLTIALGFFEYWTFRYAEFRDVGAHLAVVLSFIGAAYAPKLLDLRVAIGQAAAAIGRKFSKKETTTTVESAGGGAAGGAVDEVNIEADEVNVAEKPVVRKGE